MPILGQLVQVALAGLAISFAVAVFTSIRSGPKLPKGIPRVRDGFTSRFSFKTRLAYYTDCKNLWRDAYETYSKHGKTCIVPGMGFQQEVILPTEAVKWMGGQPDHILNVGDANATIDQADYTMPYKELITEPWQGHLVRTDIMKVLETLMVGLSEELGVGFDRVFGTDTERWLEVDLWTELEKVVAQASSRFTVGLPLCRNQQYLKDAIRDNHCMVTTAGLIGCMPKVVRPILGPIVTLPNRYFEWRQREALRPYYNQRIGHIVKPSDDPDFEEPVDHFQMILRYARDNCPAELNLRSISARLILSNFGAIHNTSMAITHLLFDIIASDPKFNTIALLREEMDTVFAKYGAWTRPAVSKMIRADSAMRESIRMNMFGNRSLLRIVKTPDGIKTPDGFLIPQGTFISILSHPAQQDGEMIKDPDTYDPFRYSRVREAAEAASDKQQTEGNGTAAPTGGDSTAALTFVTTGPSNMIFGHGRHACPGRFLVDFEFKMILAYVLAHYDIELPKEYNGKRPESRWILEATMPPAARLRFRRRKGTA